jgi:RNAse (barnase) inhibitor barstar
MNVAPSPSFDDLLSEHTPAVAFGELPEHTTVQGDADEGAIALCRLSVRSLVDLAIMHDKLSASLGFPGYYGNNWDALLDVLSDPFVLGARRAFVIVLEDGPAAHNAAPRTFATLVEVAQLADRRWRTHGETGRVRLLVLTPPA